MEFIHCMDPYNLNWSKISGSGKSGSWDLSVKLKSRFSGVNLN